MRLNSRSAPRLLTTSSTKLLVGLVALLAVVTGLMSMHALDATTSHSGQPTAVIAEMLATTDHVDSIVSTTSSSDALQDAGLIGCAAAGLLCALGVIALVKRSLNARTQSVKNAAKAPPRVAPLTATITVPRTAPSLFALTVIRT